MPRRRLDSELVRRKLAGSTDEAATAIAAGLVLVNNARADNPARMVAPEEAVHVQNPPKRFVSRGGEKLDAALVEFRVNVERKRVLDAGASTGGFTHCLLQRNASYVVAVDVGYGQMVEPVRSDPRVKVVDRTNIRAVTLDNLGEPPFDLVVGDLSFISLVTVAPALAGLVTPEGEMVLLVKPQFEAEHDEVTAGRGVLRDPRIWRRVLLSDISGLADCGIAVDAVMVSPLRGSSGNVEFLVHARLGTVSKIDSDRIEALVAEVVPPGPSDVGA